MDIRKILSIICFLMPMLLLTSLLSSCIESEEVEDIRVGSKCFGRICSIGLIDARLNRTIDVLGKVREKLYSFNAIELTPSCKVHWQTDSNYSMANDTSLEKFNLNKCGDDQNKNCSEDDANPTGYIFDKLGDHEVLVEGIIMKNGKPIEIKRRHVLNTKMSQPRINVNSNDLAYSFPIDTEYTGIPDNSSYDWKIIFDKDDTIAYEEKDKSKADVVDHTFTSSGNYTIELTVTTPEKDVVTSYKHIRVEPLVPDLNVVAIGKKTNVSIDLAKYGIPSNSVFDWRLANYDDINVVGRENVNFDLPQYKRKEYTIFANIEIDGEEDDLNVSKTFAAGYNAPKIIKPLDTAGAKYDFDLDFASTYGLDKFDANKVKYRWYVTLSDEGTESLMNTGKSYTLIFNRNASKPPHKVRVETIVDGENIGEDILYLEYDTVSSNVIQPEILYAQESNPRRLKLSAEMSKVGLPNLKWNYSWIYDGSEISDLKEFVHEFPHTSTDYDITLIAKATHEGNNVERKITKKISTYDAEAPVINQIVSANEVTFSMNATDLEEAGITDDWGYEWSTTTSGASIVGVNTDSAIVTYPNYNVDTNNISLKLTHPEGIKDVEIELDNIKTGTAGSIGISADPIDSANPRKVTYSVDNSNLHDSANWTYQWSILDGGTALSTSGDKTESVTYEFEKVSTNYNIELVATHNTNKDSSGGKATLKETDSSVTTGAVPSDVAAQITIQATATSDPLVFELSIDKDAAELQALGIDGGWTYAWSESASKGTISDATAAAPTITFDTYEQDFNIELTLSHGSASDTVTPTTLTEKTGTAGSIGISADPIDSANPRKVTYSVDNSNLHDSANWTYQWSILDGGIALSTSGDKTESVTYEFEKVSTNYHVELVATHNTNKDSSGGKATLKETDSSVTTGAVPSDVAAQITIQATATSDPLVFELSIDKDAAELQDLGIDGGWTYAWSESASKGTISDATAAAPTITFDTYEQDFNIELTLSHGSASDTVTPTTLTEKTGTAGILDLNISYYKQNDDPRKVYFEVKDAGLNAPKSWSYTWKLYNDLNAEIITTGSKSGNKINHTFSDYSRKYKVQVIANDSKGNKVKSIIKDFWTKAETPTITVKQVGLNKRNYTAEIVLVNNSGWANDTTIVWSYDKSYANKRAIDFDENDKLKVSMNVSYYNSNYKLIARLNNTKTGESMEISKTFKSDKADYPREATIYNANFGKLEIRYIINEFNKNKASVDQYIEKNGYIVMSCKKGRYISYKAKQFLSQNNTGTPNTSGSQVYGTKESHRENKGYNSDEIADSYKATQAWNLRYNTMGASDVKFRDIWATGDLVKNYSFEFQRNIYAFVGINCFPIHSD